MSFLEIEQKERLRFEYGRLFSVYGWSLNKMELCEVLSCGTTQLNVMMKNGTSPKFKKSGTSNQSAVMFFTYDIAKWMCDK